MQGDHSCTPCTNTSCCPFWLSCRFLHCTVLLCSFAMVCCIDSSQCLLSLGICLPLIKPLSMVCWSAANLHSGPAVEVVQATGASVCTTANYVSQGSTQSKLCVISMDVRINASSGLGIKESCCVQDRVAATGQTSSAPPSHATTCHDDSFLTAHHH